ncbi:MAG: imidazole glycerol phosphate synthase subunit HisF [Flavobacteriales bacterium]|nr:imidazole glycerol phosphate synthase subunit HisF [Flavobacteriales bacterium]
MLAKRIIPCLDVKDGRTVKGTNFVGLRDAGDIVELSTRYCNEGADELVFLDITASHDRRTTQLEWVQRVAQAVNIPFTVGGGISSVADVEALLNKGADKISVNSSALARPELISELSHAFGSQCVVVAMDARKEEDGQWRVYVKGGRERTDVLLYDWAKKARDLGAGEILFTSMDNDGTNEGFALEPTCTIADMVDIPVIASGGAGTLASFYDAFAQGHASAALAAGVFHYGKLTIPQVKAYLRENGIEIRTVK